MRAIQTLVPDSFCPLTNPQPYQRDGAEPPLAAASVANIENCFIKSNVDITTASGWLQRLVRPFEQMRVHHLHLEHRTQVDLGDALHRRAAETPVVAQLARLKQ